MEPVGLRNEQKKKEKDKNKKNKKNKKKEQALIRAEVCQLAERILLNLESHTDEGLVRVCGVHRNLCLLLVRRIKRNTFHLASTRAR